MPPAAAVDVTTRSVPSASTAAVTASTHIPADRCVQSLIWSVRVVAMAP